MADATLSGTIKRRLSSAAQALHAVDPVPQVGPMLDRSFSLPRGAPEYRQNSLRPGAVAFEPSFSEEQSHAVRFTMEPLPGASPISRRDEATRNVRLLAAQNIGSEALRWFDERSEEWRGSTMNGRAAYGAWFGAAFDEDGLAAAKASYEMMPGQADALRGRTGGLVRLATDTLPGLVPLFTSLSLGRSSGTQRVTFLYRGTLRLADLQPLLERLGMAHQLAGIMRIVGLALGGRFDLPERSVMLGLRDTAAGPELKLEVLLTELDDVPAGLLDLLALGLAERPRELLALTQWLQAFTPDSARGPGQFSVLSIRVTPRTPARVSLYLRPIEFELAERLEAAQPLPAYA